MRIRETVYKNIDHTYEQKWLPKSIKGIVAEEEIDYFLESPYYKSQVIKYFNDRNNIFGISRGYKKRAFDMYHEIYNIINSEEDISEFMKKNRYDNSNYNDILGDYKLINKTNDDLPDTASIIKEEGLCYIVFNDIKHQLIWHKNNYFEVLVGQGSRSTYCQFNKFNVGDLFFSVTTRGNATYTKIE